MREYILMAVIKILRFQNEVQFLESKLSEIPDPRELPQ